jgi:hypothetical protein
MKRVYVSIFIFSVILVSCDTKKNRDPGTEKVPGDTSKKVSLIGGVLELLQGEVQLIQTIGDAIKPYTNPGKALRINKYNDSLLVFRDSTEAKSSYIVKMTLCSLKNHKKDSLPGFYIKSIYIKTPENELQLSKYAFNDLKKVYPDSIKVFTSENKKNIILYPYGLPDEKSVKIIIDPTSGGITRIG